MRPVTLTWAGGEHDFLLTIDHLRALQEKCDAGPAFVLQRLSSGRWLVDDVIQPIRLALEGGGLTKEEARRLVKRHVEDEPLALSVMTAQAVLAAAILGVEDDPVGELQAGETGASKNRSPAGNSDGQASTAGPASSGVTSVQ